MLICGLLVWLFAQAGPSAGPGPLLRDQGPAVPPPKADIVAEAANLRFYSAFWPNLHHSLYVAAWDRRPAGAEPRRLAGTLPEPLTGPLTPDERAAWDAAVAYYDRELASHDLLFDDRLSGPVRSSTRRRTRWSGGYN